MLFAVAVSRTWVDVTPPAGQQIFASQAVKSLSGSDLAPWVAALAVVGLAAWGAVLFTRTFGRRVSLGLATLSQATALAGLVSAVVGSAVHDELVRRVGSADGYATSLAPWLVVAALAGVVAVAVAVISFLACGSWPSMGSRYDAPAGAAEGLDDPWKQLDAGIDPTE